MDQDIALHTGYLLGYLMKMGIDVRPVYDDENNYLPLIDIALPNPVIDGAVQHIRVEVVS